MNRIILCFSTIMVLMSGCTAVPQNIKTSNGSTNVSITERSVTNVGNIKEAVSDSSKIYNNDYQQIKIKPGLDLDFSNVTDVETYSLSNVKWNDSNTQKVIDFFKDGDFYGETKEIDSGVAIDGGWTQYSDGEHDITIDSSGYVAYNANRSSPNTIIVDSFKYGDERCDKKYELANGNYSFNEVDNYINGLLNDWKTIDESLSFVPAEIFVCKDEYDNYSYDIFYAKQANGIKFDYELSSTFKDNSTYLYLNVQVDSFGDICFWSNNNGIYTIKSIKKINGPFVTLDEALKIIQEKFTPHTDFIISEIMLSYEMIYDKKDKIYKTTPCWKFNFNDNSDKDEYTHKVVQNVYIDIISGELFDRYNELACW